MKDTPAAFEEEYRTMIMARPAEERLSMALSMFDTARALVLASFPAGLSNLELRARLLARFYPELRPDQIPPELRR